MAFVEKSLPPLRTMQASLHRTTESLAAELAVSGRTPPDWSELEWRLAPAVAAMHGVSSLLGSSLQWRGPSAWNDFLVEQRRHTQVRQQRCEELLARLDEQARNAGIAMITLKGAALHAAGVYAAGERPMADLDLLVRPTELELAVAALLSLSYRSAGSTWKHHNFDPADAPPPAPLGEHADNPIKIELHSRVAERLPLPTTDITDLVYPSRAAPGINTYPSPASAMLHVLAHCAGSMVHRGLRLIQLCDIARLTRRMTDADWGEFLLFDRPDHRLWWAYAPLTMTRRYFPDSVPPEIVAPLRRGCPWLLRRVVTHRTLSEFSYSHLFIDPLAGVVWTRSPAQLVRYLAARAHPSKEQLAQLDLLSRTGPWASAPGWYAQSHPRRILHWLSSRPTRVETMQTVRAALGG